MNGDGEHDVEAVSNDEEYEVEAVLHREKFDELVALARAGKAIFLPQSIIDGLSEHSKYAYLIHWKDFGVTDRTWEPEENLEDSEQLIRFKLEYNFPTRHEKITKTYGSDVLNQLYDAQNSVTSTRYLKSPAEKHQKRLEKLPVKEKVFPEDDMRAERLKKQEKVKNKMAAYMESNRNAQEKKKLDGEGSSSGGASSSKQVFKIPKIPQKQRSASVDKASSSSGTEKKDSDRNIKTGTRMITASTRPHADRMLFREVLKNEFGIDDSIAFQRNHEKKEQSHKSKANIPREWTSNVRAADAPSTSSFGKRPKSPKETKSASIPTGTRMIAVSSKKKAESMAEKAPGAARKKEDDISAQQFPSAASRESTQDVAQPSPSEVTTSSSSGEHSPLRKKSKSGNIPTGTREIRVINTTNSQRMEKEEANKGNNDSGNRDVVVQGEDVQCHVAQPQSSSSSVSGDDTTLAEESDDQRLQVEAVKMRREHGPNTLREIRKVIAELDKFPVEIEATRVTRSFKDSVDVIKNRRCTSEERLMTFLSDSADLEIFGRNNEACSRTYEDEDPAVVKVIPKDEPEVKKPDPKPKNDSTVEEELVRKNMDNLEKMTHRWKKNIEEMLPHLVTAYSKDDTERFKEIVSHCLPQDVRSDAFRYATVVFMTSFFDHKQWEADTKGFNLVEADATKTSGNILEHNPLCSKNHRKCAWMKLFLELMPRKMRFLQTSDKNCNGDEEIDDGPFRDDAFLHCMNYGAECQKQQFFKYNKPIGAVEQEEDGYLVDGMHLLAVKYGNLQRVVSYVAWGGLDINALATCLQSKKVYNLHGYLELWIAKNVTGVATNKRHIAYYNDLLEMVARTGQSLDLFVKTRVNALIADRMNMMWKIQMDITLPHILRCSPMSNKNNGDEGTHQVLTCLFSPQGSGLRDGLPAEQEGEDADVKKLRLALGHYRDLLGRKQGRLLVALYRIDVGFQANVDNGYAIPQFRHVTSDDGFNIEGAKIIRPAHPTEDPPSDEISIDLVDFGLLKSPGALYYVVKSEEDEKNLLIPGNAYIEIVGEFQVAMSFVTQAFFISKNT